MSASVVEDRDKDVVVISLDRPQRRNSLDYDSGRRLLEAVVGAARSVDVRAIVLRGTGEAFCAGDDLAAIEGFRAGDVGVAPASADTGEAFYLKVCEELLLAPKPVIAAVRGAAIGPGVELACAADLRVGGPGTRLGCGLIHAGHVGVAAMLRRVVGPARATEIFLTGRMVEAAEASRIGLLDRIAPNDQSVTDTAITLAQQLAAGPTKAIGLFKDMRERCEGQSALYALRLQDRYHQLSHNEVADSEEGLRALRERRQPRFAGR
ncbi:2-(1,2-epoxy-1,2-dihydrophenyl)acetyl-CoA isomerase [Prauserella marina]|uniref:2-(1,2-epoxy-1,2-dihydrophenyl)acetyl-CoA isomerase n=1 Tax=Prauserella marina TaxID=530584 RepID=A0A1G6VD33_9PSEU|nr:2-(1,2-epoxy-1,2-dihydrophenyl)acetyl-CoA isomerase [Prauserella marina]SDD50745.1 2-(1,2-epoxy-1,2-dihydrophenyl)acetyl-CoA isomerase [Prauserella marina]